MINYVRNILVKSKKLQNISLSFFSKIIIMVFYFLSDILIARFLSVNDYAEWTYFYSIISIVFWISWFGLNISSKIFVSKHMENEKDKAKYIIISEHLRFIITGIFFVAFLLMYNKVAIELGYPDKYHDLKFLLLIGAFMMVGSNLNEFYKELFLGLNLFKNIIVLAILEYGGYFLFSLIGILAFGNVYGIALGYTLALGFSSIVGYRYILKEYNKKIKIDKEEFIKKTKSILKYAMPILFMSFGGVIVLEMDTLMLGMLGDKSDIAFYSVAKKIVSKAVGFNDAFCAGIIVTFACITKENINQKLEDYKKITIGNIILTVGLALAMLILGPIAVNILYGEEYSYSGFLLIILVPYYILNALSHFWGSVMDFQQMALRRSIYFAIMILLNLILNFLLIPKYNSIGAVLATIFSTVPYALLSLLSNIAIFKRYLQ